MAKESKEKTKKDKKKNKEEKAGAVKAVAAVVTEVPSPHKAEGSCCHPNKERSEKEVKDLINRLNRIEGQVRGIKRMVEEDSYCPNILIQVAAVNAALNSFNKVLLAEHIRTCVAEDIRLGKDETIDELVATLQKLMK